MLAEEKSIINEQEAMLGQIEFLRGYSTKWKMASAPQERDQQALYQLIFTVYYLKEGLEVLYGKEDAIISSKPGNSSADDIRQKHIAVKNSLNSLYCELVALSSNMLRLNKEHIFESINQLCQTVTLLSSQENAILKSHINTTAVKSKL